MSWKNGVPKRWLVISWNFLIFYQLNRTIIILASSPFSNPFSKNLSSSSIIVLLFFHLLKALLQLDNLLRLSIETLLSERFLLIGFLELDFGPSSFRTYFQKILTLAFVFYNNHKTGINSKGNRLT